MGSFSFAGVKAENTATADSNSFPPFPPYAMNTVITAIPM